MDEVTGEEGRTILFVSHNLTAIQNLCKRCILIEEGKIKMIGKTEDIVYAYIEDNNLNLKKSSIDYIEDKSIDAQILKIEIKNKQNELTSNLRHQKEWKINIKYQIKKKCLKTMVTLDFFSKDGTRFYFTTDNDNSNSIQDKEIGIYNTTLLIDKNFLNPGYYYLKISIQSPGREMYDMTKKIMIKINSNTSDIRNSYYNGEYMGFLSTITHWKTTKY